LKESTANGLVVELLSKGLDWLGWFAAGPVLVVQVVVQLSLDD